MIFPEKFQNTGMLMIIVAMDEVTSIMTQFTDSPAGDMRPICPAMEE